MRRVLAAALVGWLAVPSVPAVAQDAPAPAPVQAPDKREDSNWIGRFLHTYFGRPARSGAALQGRTEQLVERYMAYAGRTIEVVIVNPVLRFDGDLADGQEVSRGGLEGLASPLWTYTRESTVRQYLLFDTGDRLDPFKLADSERMLRRLEYINDVRILVLPIEGAEGSVAIVVETRDRWPLVVTGEIINTDRYEASLSWTNGLGVGLRFDNRLLVNRAGDPQVGYRGGLGKENLAGSFIDTRVEYEDSWRVLRKAAEVERRAAHPAIRGVGGISGQFVDDRENDDVPRSFEQGDIWAGRVFQLDIGDPFRAAARGGRRQTLTPALGITAVDYLDRPAEVSRDTLRAYHDRRLYLAGLTYENLADLKTSYLFRMGETEDLPDGYTLKGTFGYENGEFMDRALGYGVADFVAVAGSGGISWFELGFGGYLREQAFEDGLLDTRAGWISPLLGEGRWRHRYYAQLHYLLGINRTSGRGVVLGGRSGIRDLPDDVVYGDQRLVLNLESRVFTPWRIGGFDTMFFGYGDLGVAGGESDAIFQQTIYSALGLGVRISNAEIVMPTIEFHVGVARFLDETEVVFAFDVGDRNSTVVGMPGVRPGTIAYR